jgi:hypothetical protein
MTWWQKTWAWITRNFKEDVPLEERIEALVAPPQGTPDILDVVEEPVTEELPPPPPPPPPITHVFLQERGTAVFIPIAFSNGALNGYGSIYLEAEESEVRDMIKLRGTTACLRGFLHEQVMAFRRNEAVKMTKEQFENHLRDR